MSDTGLQLTRLLEWYAAHRDDEWEHRHGIKLETLDGIGKSLIIDTAGTALAALATDKTKLERSTSDWLQWWFEPGAFRAVGGMGNVAEMIEQFFAEADARARQAEIGGTR